MKLDLFYHPYVFYNISMRRFFIMIFILILTLSCGSFTLTFIHPTPTATLTSLPPITTTVPPSPPSTISPPSTPSPLAATPTLAPSTTPNPLIETFTVLYHPDDVLYVGDQVSFEVISPPGLDVKDANLRVQVDPPGGPNLGPVNFAAWGIQGRDEATMIWAWDTQNLDPSAHTLSFEVQPQGYSWTEQVTLLPSSAMPPDQASAY